MYRLSVRQKARIDDEYFEPSFWKSSSGISVIKEVDSFRKIKKSDQFMTVTLQAHVSVANRPRTSNRQMTILDYKCHERLTKKYI